MHTSDEINMSIRRLTDDINNSSTPDSALFFERGKLFWKTGDKGAAITDFNTALSLDPASPAKAFLDMATDVMDFYNTDLYNP